MNKVSKAHSDAYNTFATTLTIVTHIGTNYKQTQKSQKDKRVSIIDLCPKVALSYTSTALFSFLSIKIYLFFVVVAFLQRRWEKESLTHLKAFCQCWSESKKSREKENDKRVHIVFIGFTWLIHNLFRLKIRWHSTFWIDNGKIGKTQTADKRVR